MSFKIGWFSTGRDKAARDLLKTAHDHMLSGRIPAEISFVFCNRDENEAPESDRFLSLVRELNLSLVTFSSNKFRPDLKRQQPNRRQISDEWRHAYHHQVLERLADYRVDLSVLAGYMLVVSPEMCERLDMVNLHPAAPGGPAGTWQEVIAELIASHETEAGAMIHLVTAELDQGPPIAYFTIPINGAKFQPYWNEVAALTSESRRNWRDLEDTRLFREIRGAQVLREVPLLLETLSKLANGDIKILSGKVTADGVLLEQGLCLNREVEEALAASAG